jgi:hypothetical protein
MGFAGSIPPPCQISQRCEGTVSSNNIQLEEKKIENWGEKIVIN